MTSINPSLPFLAGLHLQSDPVDTPPPVAVQNPPSASHPPAAPISSHIMVGKEKIAVGSSKPLNSKQKSLLNALLKAQSDLKTVTEVQGHTYEVNVKVANRQLSHLTATCTSDPEQNIHDGNALDLAFEPVSFLNKIPHELKIEIAKHTATKEEGVSPGVTLANKSLRNAADDAIQDGLRALGYDNSEIQTINALPLSHRNFIVGSAKMLFAAGYDKASLLVLASRPREQQRFVLDNHELLSRHGHMGGTELNLVAASPRNSRFQMVITLQHHERIRNEQITLALENMRQNPRPINRGPAPNIEF
ncbi:MULTISPECIES: hypothetical protein [Pseudomonas]|uniref:Uncharacterized protein n=1 Tax=Pseudomonas quercus TaxID=2722792 RepID=A0ABX0YJ61_9PSED|nr:MULTISPECIES: hypothetical protein [Pseudomonas]MBF7144889.1 hypothetical protein [Pseudomonas sp. LY10J]NJP03440.1 hypothetical protein [Pseudomonas quercus]